MQKPEYQQVDERYRHLIRFYSLLERLEKIIGGERLLSVSSGRQKWPERGVYFFRESGESRTDTGSGPRIVRVGSHALKLGAKTTLWKRLSQHKGQTSTGGGSHRGSIFRLIMGAALVSRDSHEVPTWGHGNTASRNIRSSELTLERIVSKVIGNMTLLWLPIKDEAGPESMRGYIERNSIALLSNYNKTPLDPPSLDWLGHHCDRERVRNSGLWNSNHVYEGYDPQFLDKLDRLIGSPS